MCAEDPAGIHYFTFWAGRAQSKDIPGWLRIVALAYSSHQKNGHAPFHLGGKSTLYESLGIDDSRNSKLNLQRDIRKAVANGFLSPESNIHCLVLPDEICGGAKGHAFADCKLHRETKSVSPKSARPGKTPESETKSVSSETISDVTHAV